MPGVDVVIFKIVHQKVWRTYWRSPHKLFIFLQKQMVFEKAPIFRRKLANPAKIVITALTPWVVSMI
jgi:hypothetical protein